MDFISKQILTLNAVQSNSIAKSGGTSRSAKSHFVKCISDSSTCAACKGKHSLMQCTEFKAKSASDKKNFVEANKLCFNCLGNHFLAKCQSVKTCFTCKSRHHTLLHDAYAPSDGVSSLAATRAASDRKAILLATARVTITDHLGRPQDVRALIDQGSEVSLVSETLAQRLRLPRIRSSMVIAGIGGASGATRGRLSLSLASGVTGATLPVMAYVLPRLSTYQGPIVRSTITWPHIRGLSLADPQYLDRDPIELLLGADVYSAILQDGLRKGRKDEPIAQRTSLGWILSGGNRATAQSSQNVHQCSVDHQLNDLVQLFWEQEREPAAPVALTAEEKKCEDLFTREHTRTTTGRYVVRLPFTGAPPSLTETRKPAERLLNTMERRCSRDARFGNLYRSFMQDYEDLQHMEAISTSSASENTAKCYLPHHAAGNEHNDEGVVFNGSQLTHLGHLSQRQSADGRQPPASSR